MIKKILSFYVSIFLTTFFISLLSGCLQTDDITSTEVPTTTSADFSKTTPTQTAIHPTEETATSNDQITQVPTDCITIKEISSGEDSLVGVIAIDSNEGNNYLYDIDTGNEILLPQGWGTMAVSSDGSKIGVIDQDSQEILILDSHGQKLQVFPAIQMEIAEWLNQDDILLFRSNENPLPTAVVMNTTNGNVKEIPLDFPSITDQLNAPGSNWHNSMYSPYFRFVIDPALHYVLYTTSYGVGYSTGDLVLWDFLLSKEIGRVYGIDKFTTTPVWSPDGQRYIVESIFEQNFSEEGMPILTQQGDTPRGGLGNLYIMDVEGHANKLTNFKSTARFYYYSWSPDGSKIAVWVDRKLDSLGGGILGIINVDNGEISNYCIRGYGEIFWSPDGNSLILSAEDVDNPRSGNTDIFLLNLEDFWGIRLIENANAAGWLLSAE